MSVQINSDGGTMRAVAATDVGRIRNINQDCVYSSVEPVGSLPNLFIVADGMGGHKAGDIASRMTVDSVVERLSKSKGKDYVTLINDTIVHANDEVIRKASESEDYAGMGTTLVLAAIFGNVLKVANVGDSRLYTIGDGIQQITRDHSLVEEMVSSGELNRADARIDTRKNIITRAIGGDLHVEAEMFSVELKPADYVLMCSDGLSNMVDDEQICQIVKESADIEVAARKLISTANGNGGRDNISVVLIKQ
jgi:protein phosphatase